MVRVEGRYHELTASWIILRSGQATKLAKEYEKQGGDYEETAGSKNEPKKGAPQKKSE